MKKRIMDMVNIRTGIIAGAVAAVGALGALVFHIRSVRVRQLSEFAGN